MPFKNFTILTKTASVVCSVTAALVVALAFISHSFVTHRFTELEKKDAKIQVQRTANEVKKALQKVEASTKDYAPWDDTCRFVQEGHSSYIEGNMPDSTFVNLHLNFMLFFNEDGRLTQQKFFDLSGSKEVEQDNEVLNTILDAPPLMIHTSQDTQAHISGILVTPSGKLLLVAAAPIVTSKFEGPIRGTLVMGHCLDETEISQINANDQLSIRIHPYQKMATVLPAEKIHEKILLSQGPYVLPLNDQTIAGYAVLPDVMGKPAVTIEVLQERELFQQGLTMWRQFAITLGILGFVFIVLMLVLLNRFILQKLIKVTNEVDRIVETGNQDLRLTVRGNDEIDHLTERINSMLEGLKQSLTLQEENENYLKVLLDSIDCGVMVINVNDRLVTDINKAGTTMLNRTKEEVVGQLCHQFICPQESDNCPILDHGQVIELSERIMMRADGSALSVLKSVALVERGGQDYLIESFIDIGKLRETQRALENSEAKYRLFFEEDLTSNFISTPDGRILECNPAFARMLGYQTVAEANLANMFNHCFTPADRESIFEKLRRKKRLERYELKLRHLDGNPIYCIGNLIGGFNDQGELIECRAYIFDDTRRVVLENDLRQSQKMEAIGTLAGGIAHDFNNILAGIMGYTEIAIRDLADNPSSRVHKYLHNILSGGERARDLIKQILTFSRQSEIELRPVLLQQEVADVIQLMWASLPATITIKQQLKSQATVMADQVQIHQIIMNLCANAGHAMKDDGGVLTISLEDITLDRTFTDRYQNLAPGNYVRIQVSDTGKGIPLHLQDRIFDPFFTTKKKNEGTGLGLSMIHGIVSSMNGLITVASEEGKGTQFDIYLPRIENPKEQGRVEQVSLPTGSEHIVFVDDDLFLVEIGKEILRGLGYRVTDFSQSAEALHYLNEHHGEVDLLVTDVTMPTITGLDLARSLQKQNAQVPVILCTGYSEESIVDQARTLKISDFILKPITLNTLADKVRAVLDKAQHERHTF